MQQRVFNSETDYIVKNRNQYQEVFTFIGRSREYRKSQIIINIPIFKVLSIGSPVWRPPSSDQSRRASRPRGSCSPLALLQNLHASSTCSRGILSTSNETSISTININIKEHHLYCTCSSPCERPSPKPGSPENSTCDQFSLLTSMCSSHND